MASGDYTIRFSAISSKVVVSDSQKDHNVLEDPDKGFSTVSVLEGKESRGAKGE